MENQTTTIEKLIEKAGVYVKTTLELCKYETVNKSADMFSVLAVKLVLTIVVFTFSIFINIGLALCLGKYFGETYYGFFIISFVYLLLGIILYIFKNKWIKYPVSNFIISQMSNNETI